MRLGGADDQVALIDAASGARTRYAELRQRVAEEAAALRAAVGPHGIVVVFGRRDLATVVTLYGAFAAGVPVALLDAALDEPRAATLLSRYRPEVVRGRTPEAPWPRGGSAPHPSLALLLSTSGSTGSPKLVRLSTAAVARNVEAIAQALRLDDQAVAITSLPLPYAFGLSVITSHLAVGATVVLTSDGVLDPDFWQACRDHRVTSLAGVPFTYEQLRRVDLARAAPASLRAFSQAGGAMAPERVREVHALAAARGGGLTVMYGQTEATARIAVLPPAALPARAGWVGYAVPGGAVQLDGDEIVYRGDNVMMGYAVDRDDLARGDDLGGVLRTGDLGELDGDGCLRITGRRARHAKLFGHRVDLDDLERIAAGAAGEPATAAAVAVGERVRVFVAGATAEAVAAARRALAAGLGVPSSAFEVVALEGLPRLATGKPDYVALETRA